MTSSAARARRRLDRGLAEPVALENLLGRARGAPARARRPPWPAAPPCTARPRARSASPRSRRSRSRRAAGELLEGVARAGRHRRQPHLDEHLVGAEARRRDTSRNSSAACQRALARAARARPPRRRAPSGPPGTRRRDRRGRSMPPMVPRERIGRCPTSAWPPRSSGRRRAHHRRELDRPLARHRAERDLAVVLARCRRAPRSGSGRRARRAALRRKFSSGIRLWPPARTLASPP